MINRNVGLGDKFSGGRTGFIVFKGKTVVGVVVGAVVGGAVAVIVGIGIGVRSAQIVVGRWSCCCHSRNRNWSPECTNRCWTGYKGVGNLSTMAIGILGDG
jgi:hypothetical protein